MEERKATTPSPLAPPLMFFACHISLLGASARQRRRLYPIPTSNLARHAHAHMAYAVTRVAAALCEFVSRLLVSVAAGLHFIFVICICITALLQTAGHALWRGIRVLVTITLPIATASTTRGVLVAAGEWAAANQVMGLPEMWALIAKRSGFVGAWRLTGVCKASREGSMVWLRTLPGLVVCGGMVPMNDRQEHISAIMETRDVWRLDLAKLRWERLSDLRVGRSDHACCAIRGAVVVLGGHLDYMENLMEEDFDEAGTVNMITASVEIRDGSEVEEPDVFKTMLPLSCGRFSCAAAVVIEERESEKGQLVLTGGQDEIGPTSAVFEVDLATGVCMPLAPLISLGDEVWAPSTAARVPDGRIVSVGNSESINAQILEPFHPGGAEQSLLDANDDDWQWRQLPQMSRQRFGCSSCVLAEGRFAVFGGTAHDESTDEEAEGLNMTSCEVLTLDGDEQWGALPPMHDARESFACKAIGGCVIVAGGSSHSRRFSMIETVEVYEESLGRWWRLPCSLPHKLCSMGSTIM